jgi:hypothetical protein
MMAMTRFRHWRATLEIAVMTRKNIEVSEFIVSGSGLGDEIESVRHSWPSHGSP